MSQPCIQGERLTALEVQMKEVIGNGQPGRLDKLEQKSETQSRLIWIGVGLTLALQSVVAAKIFFK